MHVNNKHKIFFMKVSLYVSYALKFIQTIIIAITAYTFDNLLTAFNEALAYINVLEFVCICLLLKMYA